MSSMFEVDPEGLRKILARRGIEFAILELIQNALDEDVSQVSVKLLRISRTKLVEIVVIDDNPTGFADLSHAFTLFAESKKKADPEKRGRFNLGEKLVIAACQYASIGTTTGGVEFKDRKRRRADRLKTATGSVFCGHLRMNADEMKRTEEAVRSVLVPEGITLRLNGEVIRSRSARHTFEATLPTEVADDEGYLRPTKRKTAVRLFDVQSWEVPTLYEMGIPVVELEGEAFHVDICQKVPLNVDRDNVTPAYLRKVRTHVLNHLASEGDLDGDSAAAPWVSEALESPDVTDEAVKAVIRERYGDKVVIADPSDREAQSIAESKGYAVIQPRSFSKAAHASIRRSGAVLPAGKVTPSPKPFSPEGQPLKVVPREEWTPAMVARRNFIDRLARRVLKADVSVTYANDPGWRFNGAYGPASGLTINIAALGRRWVECPHKGTEVLRFLIHEFGHHYASNHLSDEYHRAICQLGAKVARVALEEPGIFLDE